MKLQNLIVAGTVLIGTLVMLVMAAVDTDNKSQIDLTEENYLACLWHPYCNIPDTYSPILQPKSDKTETQDTKDEKLA